MQGKTSELREEEGGSARAGELPHLAEFLSRRQLVEAELQASPDPPITSPCARSCDGWQKPLDERRERLKVRLMSRTQSLAARRQPPTNQSLEEQPQLALPLEPLTVRIPVAVRLTGIGRSKLYELIKAGEVEVVKIGSSTLVSVASLRRLVQRGSA